MGIIWNVYIHNIIQNSEVSILWKNKLAKHKTSELKAEHKW